jgi:hypothetical protein
VAVVQESRGGDLGKIASGISHPLCPSAKGQGEEREEGRASRGRGWPTRVWLLVGCAKRKGKKEERNKEEEIGGLAEFHLNFERSKIWLKCWWWVV